MSQLVTGDAVVLGLRPAKVPSRALAVFIDLVLVWAVYILLSIGLLTAAASLDAAAMAAVQVGLFLLVLVGGPIAVETLSRGRSVGKLVCGLRVVQEDGGPVRFRHALVRGAMGLVEIQLCVGVIACIASLVSARGRRIGDVFAGTLVVRERVPTARGAARVPPPPPWMAGRFGELDLSRVPDGLWLAVRQYLMRAGQLDEAVSRSMAERLAEDVRACTGAPPPQGLPAAAFLAAVVAERQARDAYRAFGPSSGPGGAPVGGPGAPGGAPVPVAQGGFAPPGGAGPVSAPPTPPSAPGAGARDEPAPPSSGFAPPG